MGSATCKIVDIEKTEMTAKERVYETGENESLIDAQIVISKFWE